MHRHVIDLAFENSVTQDYVTEKLYDGLSTGAVTVVYGAPNAIGLVSAMSCFSSEPRPEYVAPNALDLAPKGSIIAIKDVC